MSLEIETDGVSLRLRIVFRTQWLIIIYMDSKLTLIDEINLKFTIHYLYSRPATSSGIFLKTILENKQIFIFTISVPICKMSPKWQYFINEGIFLSYYFIQTILIIIMYIFFYFRSKYV